MVVRIAILAALVAGAGAPIVASPVIALDSALFVERPMPGASRMLEPATRLKRGDRVVYIVTWTKTGGQGPFTLTAPLPAAVAFQRSADGQEEVSIDGGRNWGKLGQLRFGNRLATAEDVTHVRWRVSQAEAAQAGGAVTYSGFVR